MAMQAPLFKAPPPGGTGNPSQDANMMNQNMYNKQASLNASVKGGKRSKCSKSCKSWKKGGATNNNGIEIQTVQPRYYSTMAGDQGPVNQQVAGLQTTNQANVQATGDNVPLVTKGGKRKNTIRKTARNRTRNNSAVLT
ncbi:MAG: hypothetical protein WCJ54_09385 [Actinomycetota bacterium]